MNTYLSRTLPALIIYGFVLATAGADPFLNIEADKVTAHVSPTFYGLMTEEINHSYDGGIYAELIQNRIFKDDPKTPAHWSLAKDGGDGVISLDAGQAINSALTVCLKLEVTNASSQNTVGIANEGFWGIPIKPSTTYCASFYAKADGRFAGPLTVRLDHEGGTISYANAEIPRITGQWQKYTVRLTTGADVHPSLNNCFVIAAQNTGTVWFNLVSLFPPTYLDRPNGNRPDLMQMLAGMKPAFMRLPGGDYLGGMTPQGRFDFKNNIHDISLRPGHAGRWGYRSSDGMGLLEFLEWCEDLKMEPLLAVFDGLTNDHNHVAPGAALQPYVQDALDEIEYVTGDKSTTWGGERAKDGHPEPFSLHYVEIGNEDQFDHAHTYEARYAQFYDAIKARYPNLQLIATIPVKQHPVDVLDEHRYDSPENFEKMAHRYDSYDRNGPRILAGEWASNQGKPTPNMNSALGDAAWLTGLERNSDVVIMECYAPLFANVALQPMKRNWQITNPSQINWQPDLIGYNALTCYGSPSYYVQTMFGQNHGDVVLASTLGGIESPGVASLFENVTRDSKSAKIYLKMVNTKASPQTVQVKITGTASIASEGTAITLSSASPADTNSITDPTRIVPVVSKAVGLSSDFSYTFPPYSVTVLQMSAPPPHDARRN